MADGFIGRSLDGGEFTLVDVLGRGGMATVYRAYSRSRDADVAVKVLAPHLAVDPGFRERFLDEFRSLAGLHHENLIEAYQFGLEGDIVYVAMRLVPGGTLKDRLQAIDGPLDLVTTARLLGQVAAVLQLAHDAGVVHLDIKPANILLGRADWPLLADFGITRAVQHQATSGGGERLAGTPAYMSPEQCRGGPVDGRSDQYSLAITAYELLTGQRPFHAETTEGLLRLQVEDPPDRPRTVNPGIPGPVEDVLLQALAKEPTERYPTIREFGEALATAVERTRGISLEAKAAGVALAPGLLGMLAVAVLGPLLLALLPPARLIGGRIPLVWPFQLLLAALVMALLLSLRWPLIGLLVRAVSAAGPAARGPATRGTVNAQQLAGGNRRALAGAAEGVVNLGYLIAGYRLLIVPALVLLTAILPTPTSQFLAVGATVLLLALILAVLIGIGRLSGLLVAVGAGVLAIGAILLLPPADLGLPPGTSAGWSIDLVVALAGIVALVALRSPLHRWSEWLADHHLMPLLLTTRPTAAAVDIAPSRRRLALVVGAIGDLILLLVGDALLRPPLVTALGALIGNLPAAIAVSGLVGLIWLVLAWYLGRLGGRPALAAAVLLGAPLLLALPVLDPLVFGLSWPATITSWIVATVGCLLLVFLRGPLQRAGGTALGPVLERGLLGSQSAPTEDALERRVVASGDIIGGLIDVALLLGGYWLLGLPVIGAIERSTGQYWVSSAVLAGVAILAGVLLGRRLSAARDTFAATGGEVWARRAAALPGIALGLAALLVAGCAAVPTVLAAPETQGFALTAPSVNHVVVNWQFWQAETPSPDQATYSVALSCSDGQLLGEFQEAYRPGPGRPMPSGPIGQAQVSQATCADWQSEYVALRQAAGFNPKPSLSWNWLDERVKLATDGSADVVETHRVLFTAGVHDQVAWTEPKGASAGIENLELSDEVSQYPVDPTGPLPPRYVQIVESGGNQILTWHFPAVAAPAERTFTVRYHLVGAVQSTAADPRFDRPVILSTGAGPVWHASVEVALPSDVPASEVTLSSTGSPTRHDLVDGRTAWFDAVDVPASENLAVSVVYGAPSPPPATPPAATPTVNPTATPTTDPASVVATETPSTTPTDTPTLTPTTLVDGTPSITPTSSQTSAAPALGSPSPTVPIATGRATDTPLITAGLSATPTPVETLTVTPLATVTPSPTAMGICSGTERMTFSNGNPLVGQQFTLTVTGSRNLSNVRLTVKNNADQPQGPTARTDNGNFEWDWQITPATAGRRDYYFYAETYTLCTTNFIVVAAPPTPSPTIAPPTPSPTIAPPTPSPTIAPPTPSPTIALPTPSSTPIPTIAPTKTPCPPLANPFISAAGGSYANVSITWRSTGGCAPYSGTIIGQYNGSVGGPTYPSHTISISAASGTTTDTPPAGGCNNQTITYTLNLKDSSGYSVTASQQIPWCTG